MSFRDDLPKDLPKCDCFQSDDDDYVIGRCCAVNNVTLKTIGAFLETAKEHNLCYDAMPYVTEVAVLALLVHLAIGGTAIESDSEEAERETFRVLEGIEARLKAKAQEGYDAIREMYKLGESGTRKGALH